MVLLPLLSSLHVRLYPSYFPEGTTGPPFSSIFPSEPHPVANRYVHLLLLPTEWIWQICSLPAAGASSKHKICDRCKVSGNICALQATQCIFSAFALVCTSDFYLFHFFPSAVPRVDHHATNRPPSVSNCVLHLNLRCCLGMLMFIQQAKIL